MNVTRQKELKQEKMNGFFVCLRLVLRTKIESSTPANFKLVLIDFQTALEKKGVDCSFVKTISKLASYSLKGMSVPCVVKDV